MDQTIYFTYISVTQIIYWCTKNVFETLQSLSSFSRNPFYEPEEKATMLLWVVRYSTNQMGHKLYHSGLFLAGTVNITYFGTNTSISRDWVGTGKRMFPNAQDATFPRFLWEKFGFLGNGIRERRPLAQYLMTCSPLWFTGNFSQ